MYIEIKAKNVYPATARKLIAKGSVIGLVTTGKISIKARKLLDEADIKSCDGVPESEFMQL